MKSKSVTDAFLRVEHLQNVFRIYLDDCFYYDDLTPVLLFLIVSACPACYHKGSYYAVSSNLYVIFFWFQISLNWEYKINVFQQTKLSKINNRNCGLLCRMCWKWTVNNVWKVCDYGVFFWSILSRTRTEYRDLNITFHILSIHRKIWTRKTPSSDIFT